MSQRGVPRQTRLGKGGVPGVKSSAARMAANKLSRSGDWGKLHLPKRAK